MLLEQMVSQVMEAACGEGTEGTRDGGPDQAAVELRHGREEQAPGAVTQGTANVGGRGE